MDSLSVVRHCCGHRLQKCRRSSCKFRLNIWKFTFKRAQIAAVFVRSHAYSFTPPLALPKHNKMKKVLMQICYFFTDFFYIYIKKKKCLRNYTNKGRCVSIWRFGTVLKNVKPNCLANEKHTFCCTVYVPVPLKHNTSNVEQRVCACVYKTFCYDFTSHFPKKKKKKLR